MMDNMMKELGFIEGKGLETLDPKRAHLIQSSSYGIDEHIYLWTAGNADLGIVDTEEMEYDLVPLLGGAGPGEHLPIALVSSNNGRKILMVCSKKVDDSVYFKYWQRRSVPEYPITVPSEYVDNDRRLF